MPKRLLHLVYTRREIDARDALAIGLLSEVTPGAELTSRGAERNDHRPRSRSVCAIKEYVQAASHVDLAVAARLAANLEPSPSCRRSRSNDLAGNSKPTDNAFIEAFNGRLRAECLNTHWFMDCTARSGTSAQRSL